MGTNITGSIIKVKTPLKSNIITIRILICCGIISMLLFINWFINPEHVGYAPVFWLLTCALIFKLVKMIHEWYHYWNPSITKMPESKREWSVDVLTTSCPGEPREMITRTLMAMKAIRYPHTNYLCDEGDDPILKKVCQELGIIHVTRVEKKDAKAGNINNALQQATGEICLVLDPDHVPVPEILDRVLAYFEDSTIGFVQCVQAYGNQSESFIAKGAAEQTYHFYGPMMMCMNSYGTVQAIGANCTFRREALDSIGGHAAGLSEDMHTAMQLHAKGWKSVYVPELLTRGIVPATLSSYYKQQLKWSRGTFELFFRTLPHLWKNFTWRQKIHYFTIPLYFLFGLISLIDIAVPVLALGMARVPWEVNLAHFAFYFLPLCTLSLIIRLYAQRWLVEKHERGFHFAGGILRTATWWIFLLGFIYTIFKIKVPYIATPKEDEHQNYVRLSIPNIIVLIICAAFVYYGLSIDWTPYSLAMASYSAITMSMLAFTIILSQQKFLIIANNFCNKIPGWNIMTGLVGIISAKSHQLLHSLLRSGTVVLILAFSLVFLSYSSIEDEKDTSSELEPKELGGFYLGAELSQNKSDINELILSEKNIRSSFNLVSFTQNWRDSLQIFSVNLINDIRKHGASPYISWQLEEFSDTSKSNLYPNICNGQYDHYLQRCASVIRKYKDPVFINLSNAFEKSNTASPKEFIKTWQYVYTFFNDLGVSNITWVWCPRSLKEESFYPGEKFVDWIGISCLNYAEKLNNKDWYSFSAIYTPYRNCFGKFKKPVIITNLGSSNGSAQTKWFNDAFTDIQNNYKEIKSVIIYEGKKKTITVVNGDTSLYISDFAFNYSSAGKAINKHLQNETFKKRSFVKAVTSFNNPKNNYKSQFLKGSPGKFQLLIKKQPYYIKGVAYNTAHDWRDGNMPLTRRQVEKDFQKIKEMGANTIRRYGLGIYDRNVLNIAEEFKLNVLYGFWFDPKIDFYKDSVKVQAYMKEVEEKVMQFKDHSSIIAWSLGNESWGLLKHRFAKPYLTIVRGAYIQLIEHLAQRIHQIDPTRPVFSCIEHEEYQLAGELAAFRDGAPSVDVIGINSYYKEQINKLNHMAWQFDSLRPYLVSEFGPRGYWDPKYNKSENHSVIEETDSEKAEWYKKQWVTYVNGYKGYNVGGFAYCWHDRMEGSYTWFGLTDFKGRLKPSYYALKTQWTNKKEEAFQQFIIQGPPQMLPGNEYSFSAIAKGGSKPGLQYEWRLLKDEYLDQIDNIKLKNNPASISVTIPEEPSDYRLYLYVTDKDNQRVTTASIPIKVSQKISP